MTFEEKVEIAKEITKDNEFDKIMAYATMELIAEEMINAGN